MSTEGQDPSASSSMGAAASDPMLGQVLDGRYRITQKLGEGGMGEVYAAQHIHIAKRVAIKLLRAEIVSNQEAVARFTQEAMSASSIKHENIIGIEDFGTLADGRIYLAMELLEGQPFNEMIKSPLPVSRLLNILIQTGHGLAAAHAKGIVHRDMKPENIFVTEGDVPKLLDFGIAKVSGADGNNNLTRTGTIFGTPFYMSPEQALGQAVDHRADIYAMGVIMYEVFTGSIPFQGESFMGILTQHITAEPAPPSENAAAHGKQIPPGIEPIITRAMKKDPDDRYQTMDELVQALVVVYRGAIGSGMSSYMEAHVPAGMPSGAMAPPGSAPMPVAHPPAPTPMPQGPGGPMGPGPGPGPGGPMGPGPGPGGPMGPGPGPGSAPMGRPPSASYTPAPGSGAYQPAKKSRAGLIIVIVVLLAAGGGGAAFYFLGLEDSNANAGQTDAAVVAGGPDAATAAGADARVPTNTLADAAVPENAGADAAVPEVKPDAGPVKPTLVKVTIKSDPSHAAVFDGRKRLGKTPLTIKLEPGAKRKLKLVRRHYENEHITVDGSDPVVKVTLDRHHGPGPGPGTGSGSGSGSNKPDPCKGPNPPPVCALE